MTEILVQVSVDLCKNFSEKHNKARIAGSQGIYPSLILPANIQLLFGGCTSYTSSSSAVKPLFTMIVMQCLPMSNFFPRSRAESPLCLYPVCIFVSYTGFGVTKLTFLQQHLCPQLLVHAGSTVLASGVH